MAVASQAVLKRVSAAFVVFTNSVNRSAESETVSILSSAIAQGCVLIPGRCVIRGHRSRPQRIILCI